MNKKIILASGSPRREELLKGLDIPFEVILKKNISEYYPENIAAESVPEYIAQEKAAAYKDDIKENEIILTADTVVICNGKILGKPANQNEARKMLQTLSNRTHSVTTGVCLTTTSRQIHFHDTTLVTFRDLSLNEIDYYIEHYHPMDKAGAYGIQEWIGYIGCTKLEGDYYNVMGLPVCRVYEELKKF